MRTKNTRKRRVQNKIQNNKFRKTKQAISEIVVQLSSCPVKFVQFVGTFHKSKIKECQLTQMSFDFTLAIKLESLC